MSSMGYQESTIRIERNRAVEMLYAAWFAAKAIENPHLTGEQGYSETSKRWFHAVSESISPFEVADLKLIFSALTIRIYLFYQIQTHRLTDPIELIRILRFMSEEEFIGGFRTLLKLEDEESWLTEECFTECFEEDWADFDIDFASEAKNAVRLLQSASYLKVRICEVLSWFTDRYMIPFEQVADDRFEKHLARYQELYEQNPAQVLDRLSSGNGDMFFSGRNTIWVYPVSFGLQDISVYMPDDVFFIYSIDLAEKVLGTSISERTEELIKTLSDPKRLEIMRLLAQDRWYSKQLASKLSLSAATVSYHIDRLFQAGLIKIDKPEGRRFYYTLNERGIEELIQCLISEFLPSDPKA